jgi:hypothetical protein
MKVWLAFMSNLENGTNIIRLNELWLILFSVLPYENFNHVAVFSVQELLMGCVL